MTFSSHSQNKFVKEGTMPWSCTRQQTYASEHVPMYFRIVQRNFETQELLCGFLSSACTRAATLFSIQKVFSAVLIRQTTIAVSNAVMVRQIRGQRCGLQALIQQEEQREQYVHCLAHTSEKVEMCRDFLRPIPGLINFFPCSPKHLNLF